jgi:hypothetical protein
MGLGIELRNGPGSLSPFQSWPDCTINTSGYDFRKGYQYPLNAFALCGRAEATR